MIVRFEEVRNTDTILIIDELSRYIGTMYFSDFSECIIDKTEPFEEDNYLFWHVNKDILNLKLKRA